MGNQLDYWEQRPAEPEMERNGDNILLLAMRNFPGGAVEYYPIYGWRTSLGQRTWRCYNLSTQPMSWDQILLKLFHEDAVIELWVMEEMHLLFKFPEEAQHDRA